MGALLYKRRRKMKVAKDTAKKMNKLLTSTLDKKGREILNPTPMAVPVGLKQPTSLRDQIKSIIENEMSIQAAQQNMETLEEANDFNVVDDFDNQIIDSQYQKVMEEFDQKGPALFMTEEPAPEMEKEKDPEPDPEQDPEPEK